jgi:WD40 repeat protein
MSHQGAALAVKFGVDGRRLATGGRDRTCRFWDVATGQPVGPVLELDGWVEDLSFSADGRRLATASGDGKVRIWTAELGDWLGPSLECKTWQVVLSADGERLATSDAFGEGSHWTLPRPFNYGRTNPRLWVESLTWQEMDEDGALSWLDAESRRERQERLQKEEAAARH